MALVERFHKTTDLTRFPGEIPVNYKYTYGIANEDFFRTIMKKGKLLATKCESCGVTYLPARMFCEQCLSHLSETFELPATGELYSFTICCQNIDGTEKDKPDIIVAVKIDGADGTFIHYLDDKTDADDIEIGMRLEAVFKPQKQREGTIFDIKHFKPVK